MFVLRSFTTFCVAVVMYGLLGSTNLSAEDLVIDPDRRDPFYSSIDRVMAQYQIDQFLKNKIDKPKDGKPVAKPRQRLTAEDAYKQCQLHILNREWLLAIRCAEDQLRVLPDKQSKDATMLRELVKVAKDAKTLAEREQAFTKEKIAIQGILWSEENPLVVVNGRSLRNGDRISDHVTVKRIHGNRIDVSFKYQGALSEFHVYLD